MVTCFTILRSNLCLQVHLSLTAHATGELHVTGVVFNLGTSLTAAVQPVVSSGSILTNAVGSSAVSGMTVRGKLVLEVQGPRLAETKEERSSKVYGPDRRLDIVIAPAMPQLQVGRVHVCTCVYMDGCTFALSLGYLRLSILCVFRIFTKITYFLN